MSDKGGSSSPSTSTVTQTSLPDYAEPYYTNLLERAQYESLRPYEAYGGQRLAEFTDQELQAMQGIEDLANAGTPQDMLLASQYADPSNYTAYDFSGNVYNPQIGQMGYAADQSNFTNTFDPGALNDYDVLQSYMDPYTESVIQMAIDEAEKASTQYGNQIADEAAMSGGLGGYREAIMQSEREADLLDQVSDITYQGYSDAFTNAQAAYEADRQAQLADAGLNLEAGSMYDTALQNQESLAQSLLGLNESNRALAAQFGLDVDLAQAGENQFNRQQQLDSSSLLSQLAGQQQDMDLGLLYALQAAGENQRGMTQAGLDIGYNDFLTQQAYPGEQIGWLSSILQGTPVTPGSTSSIYSAQPSDWQQALGTGIAGVALYNGLS